MKKVGVIAEYNPFHNGHVYHLNKVKKMFPDSYLILVLIGNFTQRGEISVINKWDKTKIALNYGYDLVVELPFLFVTQSASFYAKGAVEILDKLDCDYLVFGSELNDVKTLEGLVNTTYKNKNYESLVKKYVDKGNNYPASCSLALKDLTGKLIDKPNDVLALEYVRCIKLLNSKIKPISIKRTNDYHEEDINKKITSATSIRRNLTDTKKIKNTMPKDSMSFISDINHDKYFDLIKYQIVSSDNLNDYLDVDEGIENKLKKVISNSNNLNELILNVKSKRYSYNKIQRMLLHIVCKIKKEDNNLKLNYIRVLGMTNNGRNILKEVKNSINIPIITKYKKEYDNLFWADKKASLIYSMLTDYNVNDDFKSSIKKIKWPISFYLFICGNFAFTFVSYSSLNSSISLEWSFILLSTIFFCSSK